MGIAIEQMRSTRAVSPRLDKHRTVSSVPYKMERLNNHYRTIVALTGARAMTHGCQD